MDQHPTSQPPASGPDVRTRRPGHAPGCAPPPAVNGPGAGGWVERSLRLVEPVVRGPAVVVVTIAIFAAAGVVGGRGGVAAASAYVLFLGTYCLLNFWHCRETHCVVTGAGWTPLALLGFAAALTPAASMSWFRVNVESAAFLVILAAGYALEWAVAARTGRRALR